MYYNFKLKIITVKILKWNEKFSWVIIIYNIVYYVYLNSK